MSYQDLDEDQAHSLSFKLPEEYYQYKLKGVVIHMGEANAGHYYSYIQDRDSESWFEFNDSRVSKFDIADLDDKCFGGEENFGNQRRDSTYGTGLNG